MAKHLSCEWPLCCKWGYVTVDNKNCVSLKFLQQNGSHLTRDVVPKRGVGTPFPRVPTPLDH